MKDAIKYIKAHWQDGKSLKEIAGQFGVNPGNLERAFRRSQGITVKRYIDEKRVRFVLAVLSKTRMLGYEIGAKLGFKSDRAFYRWVRHAFGKLYRDVVRETYVANGKPSALQRRKRR